MNKPRVCVLRTAGTNCDKETAFAFEQAGGSAELVHINALISARVSLQDFAILAIPGGFSYGDDIAAGKVEANELRYKLGDQLRRFVSRGRLIIGICNGFQILAKSGFLPGSPSLQQEVSLIINDCGSFQDRWVYLATPSAAGTAACVWTAGLPAVITLPVAHGEGKCVVRDAAALKRLQATGQMVLRYSDSQGRPGGFPVNPNGSLDDIAGICDRTGRVLGLMPHPERYIRHTQHPRWSSGCSQERGDGFLIFNNGVAYARRFL